MSSDVESSSIILIPRGSTFDSVTASVREKGYCLTLGSIVISQGS